MKRTIKQAGFIIIACSLTLATYSCNNNKTTTTSSSDSTATTATVDTTAVAKDTTTTKKTNPDNDFVIDVAKSNSQEMQMLEAGSEQGSNKKLKTDAKKMLADHKKLGQELVDYATKKNITLSSDTDMDMSAMNGENESAFDTAWTQKMIAGHQQTIAKFQTALNTVSDPELKNLITNTLPTLQSHLDLCQSLMASLKK